MARIDFDQIAREAVAAQPRFQRYSDLHEIAAGIRAGKGDLRDDVSMALLGARAVQAVLTHAALDVLGERRRQVESEGWTREHDDQHSRGEIGRAGACYAITGSYHGILPGWVPETLRALWPWSSHWLKMKDCRSDLVRAGALIIAEIERLDRAAPPEAQP